MEKYILKNILLQKTLTNDRKCTDLCRTVYGRSGGYCIKCISSYFGVLCDVKNAQGSYWKVVCVNCFRFNRAKMSLAQRKDRVEQKKAAYLKKMEEEDDD